MLALAALIAPVGAAEAPPPANWPDTPGASPRLEGYPHALRVAGADRYSTSLALALALRGDGGFPFTTPDRSSGGATTLGDADDWWGVGECPRAIIVVAGDSPADALAASALSDPTGQSSEPYLQRVAAADPLFDPPGGFARVDTDRAPVIVTWSGRQGATSLSTAARIAAQDLRDGGCTQALQAIVVGGVAAVPEAVEDELVAIGYAEVFRVSGADRFATAGEVARSLGTAPVPAGTTGCSDPSVADGEARMAFHANSVIEVRDSATDCEVWGRTVVLTDGITGADALAAGWWTSFWQVPVLLHDGSGALPAATVATLETLDVDHMVILGGAGRVSEAVVDEAVDLTGADAVRISGPDRYATSVEMARRFGGWWPTGRGPEFAASMVCLAGSSGEGRGAVGWPDALGAGPWCGAANGGAANPEAPDRALAPTAGDEPSTTAGGLARPAHDAVPVLLVPAGGNLTPTVATFLEAAFHPADDWCSSVDSGAGCLEPGFTVAFGGTAAVSETAVAQASRLVSGSAGADPSALEPQRDPGFHTQLDMTPVFAVGGAGSERVCQERGTYRGVRWLALHEDLAGSRLAGAADVMLDGRYVADADGTVRSPGVGSPACVAAMPDDDETLVWQGVSLAGRVTAPAVVDHSPDRRFELTGPFIAPTPSSASGTPSDEDVSGGGTTVRTFLVPAASVGATSRGASTTVTSSAITVRLTRGSDVGDRTGPDTFAASWSMSTPLGSVAGTARGEAIFDGGTWRLRGASSFSGGSWNVASGSGGFTADLVVNEAGDPADDTLRWRVDALVDG